MPFANRRPGVADILYVMATELEYGPELKSRITPLITGVGPVEAAVALTEQLTRLVDRGQAAAAGGVAGLGRLGASSSSAGCTRRAR